MAWRSGSSARTLLAAARSFSFRSSPPLARLRPPPPLAAPRPPRTRLSFAHPRSLGELGCTQSLIPLHSVVAAPRLTSHLSISVRACCELSQGTFRRTCQDR